MCASVQELLVENDRIYAHFLLKVPISTKGGGDRFLGQNTRFSTKGRSAENKSLTGLKKRKGYLIRFIFYMSSHMFSYFLDMLFPGPRPMALWALRAPRVPTIAFHTLEMLAFTSNGSMDVPKNYL